MLTIEVLLPAAIGEYVLIDDEAFTGQAALVVAWRVARHRFLLGGVLDPAPELSLLVMTTHGEEHWLYQDEVTGFGVPIELTITLPFAGGDAVLVAPTQEPGEVRSWEVICRLLGTQLSYRVYLDGT